MTKRLLAFCMALLLCLGMFPLSAIAEETAEIPAEESAAAMEAPVMDGAAKPAMPTLTSVKNLTSGVKITWEKVKKADGYIIFRKTGSGSWERIGKVKKGSKVSYIDKTAESGTKYSYSVCAYTGTKKGSYDTDGLTILRLDAPTIKSAKAVSSGIKVTWKKVTGAKKYVVYRRAEGDADWTKLKATTSTSCTDKKAKSGVTYTYTVRAVSGKTNSAIRAGKSAKYEEDAPTFAEIAGSYMMAGNGFWSYSITINRDGSFSGKYEDANMGISGEGYTGQFDSSEYEGTFTNLRQINRYKYAFDLEELTYAHEPGTSELLDVGGGTKSKYDYTEAPVLRDGDTFYVFITGTPLSKLPSKLANTLKYTLFFSPLASSGDKLALAVFCSSKNSYMVEQTDD